MAEQLGSELRHGRESFAKRAWLDAHHSLTAADQSQPLETKDLWLLAWASGLCGREQAALGAFERIYHAELETDSRSAALAAFWAGYRLLHLQETSKGQGWLSRAERCLENEPEACVVHGYLELPRVRAHFMAGRYEEALAGAARAAELGQRFGDRDLAAFALSLQGRVLIRKSEFEEGFKLLDESMLAVTSGEVSPVPSGLIYCAAIDVCQSVFALERSREWTESLRSWCETQPQLSVFTGACLVSRAEIMEVGGRWQEALAEAQRATALILELYGPRASGESLYRQGEIHRLRGELNEAEARYRDASQSGRDPQPGLSLLRLAQGRADVAAQSLRRALAATSSPLGRAKLLPALVEISLAVPAVAEARAALTELEAIAAAYPTDALGALASLARGSVELAEGAAASACVSLRTAFTTLQNLDVPYWAAKARLLLACACQALDDVEGAALEIQAARVTFERLGALSEVRAIDALVGHSSATPSAHGLTAHGLTAHGLTARELTVLRLVAAGKTNRAIATELCLSEKTVDRHVSNILNKLDVPSRAAATAFAYENKLI